LCFSCAADELDSALAENAYLKDLLRRLHSQIEWSSATSGDAEKKKAVPRERQQVEAEAKE